MHLVRPPTRELRWEAIHATLVLALLIHALGLLACLWSQPGGEDRELRVVAQVEVVDSLPEPTRPEPLRIPAPPPIPPVATAPPSAPAAPTRPRTPAAPPALPSVSAPAAPPALPGVSIPAAPPALPGATAPRAGTAAPRTPRAPAPAPAGSPAEAAEPAPAPSPSPARTGGVASAAPGPASPASAAGTPKWAWFPGPEQPRPLSSGRLDPAAAAGVGPARVWVEMRIPANGGRATAPADVVVREVEGAQRDRAAAAATEMARTSLWQPGTRDGAPADHTIRLFLEIP